MTAMEIGETRPAGTTMPQPKLSELWGELEFEIDTLESTTVSRELGGSHDLDTTRDGKFEDTIRTTKSV